MGVYAFAVFAAGLAMLFVDALAFTGFFVPAHFFMARNLQ